MMSCQQQGLSLLVPSQGGVSPLAEGLSLLGKRLCSLAVFVEGLSLLEKGLSQLEVMAGQVKMPFSLVA